MGEAIPEVPEEEAEETKRAEKDKVRDEFEEKERKRKEEEEKIIIKPAVLPLKKKVESWEEESEEEEEETPAKKKLSKADLKPAVQIKVAIEEDKPKRLRKKQESFDADANKLFGGPEPAKVEPLPPPKPEPVPEEEEEESEEEEEVKPEKKKLSKADLKPAVQIKVAIEEDK